MADDPNIALMQSIEEKWGVAISAACKSSSVPPEFVAALIANESGGDPTKDRFEPGVLTSLWQVLMGRSGSFGSIKLADLLLFAAGRSLNSSFLAIDNLATSWGLTQIMGYEGIAFGVPITDLQMPATSLGITLRMLGQFASRFQLDMTRDFDEMFRCWNSGRPHAVTSDPNYSPNGLARMAIYKGLA